jgi:hypothetical protein
MRSDRKVLAAAAIGVLFALAAHSGFASEMEPLQSLSWMAGTWAGEAGGTATEEVWISPKGGLMLGLHRDVAAGKAVSFEFLRIEATADGIVYFASPRGAPPTPFRLVEGKEGRAVFENPKHDFPVRILYWLGLDDSLHARIEGPGQKPKAHEWVWRKVSATGR